MHLCSTLQFIGLYLFRAVDMKHQQENVSKLLRETVGVLCRSGLSFSVGLRVQGLLAVTVDNSDVFVVQFDDRLYPELADSIDRPNSVAHCRQQSQYCQGVVTPQPQQTSINCRPQRRQNLSSRSNTSTYARRPNKRPGLQNKVSHPPVSSAGAEPESTDCIMIYDDNPKDGTAAFDVSQHQTGENDDSTVTQDDVKPDDLCESSDTLPAYTGISQTTETSEDRRGHADGNYGEMEMFDDGVLVDCKPDILQQWDNDSFVQNEPPNTVTSNYTPVSSSVSENKYTFEFCAQILCSTGGVLNSETF